MDGNRAEFVKVSTYFSGGFEDAEVFDHALNALRDDIKALIGKGKKVHLS